MWTFVLLWFVILLGTAVLAVHHYFFNTGVAAGEGDSISDIAREIEIIEEYR